MIQFPKLQTVDIKLYAKDAVNFNKTTALDFIFERKRLMRSNEFNLVDIDNDNRYKKFKKYFLLWFDPEITLFYQELLKDEENKYKRYWYDVYLLNEIL